MNSSQDDFRGAGFDTRTRDTLFEALSDVPLIDVHSHLFHSRRHSSGSLAGLLFYHMLQYPMRSAGMEGFHRQMLEDIDPKKAEKTIFDAWDKTHDMVIHTGFGWILRRIMRDLYGFDKPLKGRGVKEFAGLLSERRGQPGWMKGVFKKANVRRILSSSCHSGVPKGNPLHDIIVPTGEYSMGLNMEPAGRLFRGRKRWERRLGFKVDSFDAIRRAFRLEIKEKRALERRVAVQWISGLADFRPVPEAELESIFKAALEGRDERPDAIGLIQAKFVDIMLEELKGSAKVFQICYGTQYLTGGPGEFPLQRAGASVAGTLAFLMERHPGVHMNILNGFEADEPSLCSLCVAHPDVSLGGYWWHTFYQSVMQQSWQRRLDVVPLSNLMGFFSDGYCAEWIWGRALMTRQVLANVFAERIARGFCDFDETIEISRAILWETPCRIMLGAVPPED